MAQLLEEASKADTKAISGFGRFFTKERLKSLGICIGITLSLVALGLLETYAPLGDGFRILCDRMAEIIVSVTCANVVVNKSNKTGQTKK